MIAAALYWGSVSLPGKNLLQSQPLIVHMPLMCYFPPLHQAALVHLFALVPIFHLIRCNSDLHCFKSAGEKCSVTLYLAATSKFATSRPGPDGPHHPRGSDTWNILWRFSANKPWLNQESMPCSEKLSVTKRCCCHCTCGFLRTAVFFLLFYFIINNFLVYFMPSVL